MAAYLKCVECSVEYSLDEPLWKCSVCGNLLDIDGLPVFDRDLVDRRRSGLWKYHHFLPVGVDKRVSFDEGDTPLVEVEFSGRGVWVKQEQLNPTGSHKDRGATVLISQAKALGIQRVVEDSSGNAGCAIAAYSAKAGIEADIYVPAYASGGKLVQIAWYGANLIKVPGTREDTANAALQAVEKTYFASHAWNPFFMQGMKTFAYEICEQLGWRAPDWLVLPVGNGSLLLGAAIGFGELLQAGVIGHLPRIIGVQAAGCAPVAEAFRLGLDEIAIIEKCEGIAEGIAVKAPVRGQQMLRSVRESGGFFVTVEEGEILSALREVGYMGYFVEPTAAATIAGVKKALADIPVSEVVATVFTGHGLKATDKFQTWL